MAKVLKIFVNLILVLFILSGLALLVPPLAGVTTVVADGNAATNMSTGSVAYGLSTSREELGTGDHIFWTEDGSSYIYEIVELDAETGEAVVRTSAGAAEKDLTLGETVQREIVTIPLIGYLTIALQSMEGCIILGMAGVLLIVLFIVAEVWSRRREDEEDEEDEEEDGEEEDDPDLSRRDRKALEKERKRRAKEKKRLEKRGEGEEDQFFRELADKKRAADARKGQQLRERQTEAPQEEAGPEDRKPVPPQEAEVFIRRVEDAENTEETVRIDEAPQAETKVLTEETMEAGTEEPAVQETQDQPETAVQEQEIAGEDGSEKPEGAEQIQTEGPAKEDGQVGDEPAMGTDKRPDGPVALEAALANQPAGIQIPAQEQAAADMAEETGEIPDEIMLAMPVKSVEELLQEAYTDGDDPVLREDEITGVKFVDFSDCL